jgi:hypothetical protein
VYTDPLMATDKRPRPGGASPVGKSKLAGYSARPSGPAWDRRHGHRPGARHRSNRQRSRSARWRIGLIVSLVTLAVLIGGLLIFLANRDDEPDLAGPTTALDPSTLSPEGQELYALVEASQSGTYHVALAVESPDLASAGAAAHIELWRNGDQFREHRVGVDPSGVANTVVIGGPDGAMTCGGAPGSPPTCAPADGESADPTLDGAFATVIASAAEGETTASDDTVAGQPARCFSVVDGERTLAACFTAEGTPLLLDDGAVHFEATLVEATVPDDILVLPAEGSEPPPAVTIPPPVAPPTTAPPTDTTLDDGT